MSAHKIDWDALVKTANDAAFTAGETWVAAGGKTGKLHKAFMKASAHLERVKKARDEARAAGELKLDGGVSS